MVFGVLRQAIYDRYHPNYNVFICDLSYLTALTSVLSMACGFYGHAFWTGSIFVTSQLYWHAMDPQMRQIDMFVSGSGLLYHTLIALTTNNPFLYIVPIVAGLILYGVSHLIHTERWMVESYVAHGGLHVLANLGCVLLCLGV